MQIIRAATETSSSDPAALYKETREVLKFQELQLLCLGHNAQSYMGLLAL